MSYFNEDQEGYMRELAKIPRDERCKCGWYRKGKCQNGCDDKLVEKKP